MKKVLLDSPSSDMKSAFFLPAVHSQARESQSQANPGKAASIEIPTADSLDERLRLRKKQS